MLATDDVQCYPMGQRWPEMDVNDVADVTFGSRKSYANTAVCSASLKGCPALAALKLISSSMNQPQDAFSTHKAVFTCSKLHLADMLSSELARHTI